MVEHRSEGSRNTLPERVAQYYYSHALFCSTHPILLILFVLACFLFCCYPLLNIPLPGSTPTRVVLTCSPCGNEQDILPDGGVGGDSITNIVANTLCSTFCASNITTRGPHAGGVSAASANVHPLLYIQQLILSTGVWPWGDQLKPEDAYRAPLQEVFRLLDLIRNHQEPSTGTSVGHVCYHVEGITSANHRGWSPPQRADVLPEYNCLILSPANLWHQDIDKFSLDPDPLETIFTHQSLQKGKASTAEMVFGMHLKETGIKRYSLKARTRMLQYAVTLFYSKLNVQFVRSLNQKLLSSYPESTPPNSSSVEANLIYYPADFNYYEFIPLCVAFVGLFVYIYFSVRKIEFIKSKVGLSASAVISIAAGLTMSMGICFFFGLTLSFRGKEIFPYLVILVGLENVFVLTKSVMSIDSQLDVKIRLAQGLSKEGWSITKNILVEITILTLCLFTFIPVIQQFSIFMIVNLLSDYFLQMFFFVTVLGIDIKRKERSRDRPPTYQFYTANIRNLGHEEFSKYHNKSCYEISSSLSRAGNTIPRSKSQPRLNGSCSCPYPSSPFSSNLPSRLSQLEELRSKRDTNLNGRLPKRIRLVNVWARTRFFQRAFMVWMVIWVSMLIYSSGVVEDLLIIPHRNNSTMDRPWKAEDGPSTVTSVLKNEEANHNNNSSTSSECNNDMKGVIPITGSVRGLSSRHWAVLLAHYNVSCAGHYLAVAPPLLLKHRVPPEVAIAARPPPPLHPSAPVRWRAFAAAALDPIEYSDTEKEEGSRGWMWKRKVNLAGSIEEEAEQPFYPTSMMELFLLTLLCTISVIVITYMMVVLYKCVCTRNYAEWRATWSPNTTAGGDNNTAGGDVPQMIMEAVPIVVPGHSQEIECVATDGERVVSCCLQGTIKVWDPTTGDMLTNINRALFFELQNEVLSKLHTDVRTQTQESQQDGDSQPLCIVHHAEDTKPQDICSTSKDFPGGPLILGDFKFSTKSESQPYYISSLSTKCRTIYDFTLHYRRLSERDDNKGDKQMEEMTRQDTAAVNVEEGAVGSDVKDDNCGESNKKETYTAIWCMDVCSHWDLIVVGCANGRLECWAASTGRLECTAECYRLSGITHVQVVGEYVIVGRLSGDLEVIQIHSVSCGPSLSSNLPNTNRGHVRTGSAGSIPLRDAASSNLYNRFTQRTDKGGVVSEQGCLQCFRLSSVKAHQQPLLDLECDTTWILTASLDHTVKVFWFDDLSLVYTFHGHYSPVRCLFLDSQALVCGSGSQEGLLCVWDLTTGACVYSIQAHCGPLTALSVTASYVISLGGDDRLCIWDRFRGHLLNAVTLEAGVGECGLLSLGPSLVVSGGRGGLTLWDASSATALRNVYLGSDENYIFVRHILPLRDGIVCEYSNQLRIVRFPSVTKFLADKQNKCE